MLMQACKESRDIGHKLRMPFYLYVDVGPEEIQSPKYYINVDIDTVWLQRAFLVPDHVEFHEPVSDDFPDESDDHPDLLFSSGGSKYPPQFRFNCLALDADQWKNPVIDLMHGGQSQGATDILRAMNSPRQLLIVIAKPQSFCPSKVVFVEPNLSPIEHPNQIPYREGLYAHRDNCLKLPKHDYTWEMAARRVESVLTEFKEHRAMERRIAIGITEMPTPVSRLC